MRFFLSGFLAAVCGIAFAQIPYPESRAQLEAFIAAIRNAPDRSSRAELIHRSKSSLAAQAALYHWDAEIRLAFLEAKGSVLESMDAVFMALSGDPVEWLRKAAIEALSANLARSENWVRDSAARLLLSFGEGGVKVLVEAMQSEDQRVASMAMRQLTELRSDAVISLLFDKASRELYSTEVRRGGSGEKLTAAIAVLRTLSDARVDDLIFGLLHNDSERMRTIACRLAERRDDPRIIERLKTMCWNDSRSVSLAAARALTTFNDKDGIETAFEILRRLPEEIGSSQWLAFVRFGVPGVETLIYDTWDKYPAVRRELMTALRVLGTHGANARLLQSAASEKGTLSYELLLELIRSEARDMVRFVQQYSLLLPAEPATSLLDMIRRETGIERFVIDWLVEADDRVRELVLKNAHRQIQNNPAFTRASAQLARSESGAVRYWTVKALSRSGNWAAVASLMQFLNDESKLVREMAFDALLLFGERLLPMYMGDETTKSAIAEVYNQKIKCPAYLMIYAGELLDRVHVSALANSPLAMDRRDAAVACQLLPADLASEILIQLLGDPDEAVKRCAQAVAQQIGGSRISDRFARLAGSDDWQDRIAAAEYFGRKREPWMIPILAKLLDDAVYGVRYVAARSLSYYAEPSADRALAKLMDADELPLVQYGAIGLARVASVEDWKLIMHSDSNNVRYAALSGLKREHLERVADVLWSYAQTESSLIHQLIARRLAEVGHRESIALLGTLCADVAAPLWFDNFRALLTSTSFDAELETLNVLRRIRPDDAEVVVQMIGDYASARLLSRAAEVVRKEFPQHLPTLAKAAARRKIPIQLASGAHSEFSKRIANKAG